LTGLSKYKNLIVSLLSLLFLSKLGRSKGGLREVSASYLPMLSPVFMRDERDLGRLVHEKLIVFRESKN